MATICTDNLRGNDTTGTGSPSLPYKSINKALSVASDGDLIKVAGGQFQSLSATGTFSIPRTSTVTTSTNLVGIVSVDDIIAIDTSSVDGWDKEYTVFRVNTVDPTFISFASGQPIMFPPGTYNLFRLSEYAYSTSTTTAQETITSFSANTVEVSGGWSSDFTTQHGWTAARKTGVTGGLLVSHSNIIKPNVVWDKFIMSNTSFSNGSSNASFGIRTVSFVITPNSFGTSNYGIYNPSGGTTTLICNSSQGVQAAPWNGGGNRPNVLLLDQFITADLSSVNGAIKCGYNLNYGNSTGPTIRTSNCNLRTAGTSNGVASFGLIPGSNLGDVYIDNLKIWVNQNAMVGILQNFVEQGAWKYIGNIEVYPDSTNAGICPTTSINQFNTTATPLPLTLNRTTGTLDSLPWRVPQSSHDVPIFLKSVMPALYGVDTEGYKVINQDGIPKYADPSTFVTGSNSLRSKICIWTSGSTGTIRVNLGTITKPSSGFTVNIRVKANRTLPTTNSLFSLIYGPSQSSILTLGSTPAITSSFQVFSYSVTPSSYPNWDLGNDGLMTIFYNYDSTQYTKTDNDYIWIDSITIS